MATFGYFADASGVPIYGLHTESPPQQGMTWLQKDLAIQEPSEHITVCLHMRLHFVYTDPAIVLVRREVRSVQRTLLLVQ